MSEVDIARAVREGVLSPEDVTARMSEAEAASFHDMAARIDRRTRIRARVMNSAAYRLLTPMEREEFMSRELARGDK